VRILRIQHGLLPGAETLNPRFLPGHPLLLATLDVDWHPTDPLQAVAALEKSLLAFSPGFALHECRGEGIYHVFSGGGARRSDAGDFEAALALAHLIEHAVIDFQAGATGAGRCSGITAAHRDPLGRFDLMVECREPEVGRCCLRLAVSWLTRSLLGRGPGAWERDILEILRISRIFSRRPLFAPEVARELGWREKRCARVLEALAQADYLVRVAGPGGISGRDGYQVGRAETMAGIPSDGKRR
jgi:hypothetical protein